MNLFLQRVSGVGTIIVGGNPSADSLLQLRMDVFGEAESVDKAVESATKLLTRLARQTPFTVPLLGISSRDADNQSKNKNNFECFHFSRLTKQDVNQNPISPRNCSKMTNCNVVVGANRDQIGKNPRQNVSGPSCLAIFMAQSRALL